MGFFRGPESGKGLGGWGDFRGPGLNPESWGGGGGGGGDPGLNPEKSWGGGGQWRIQRGFWGFH